MKALFAAYVEAKQRQSVLDYDDLLLYLAQMLGEPAIAEEISSRFDHLLVDEYQDTNTLQAEIALALRPRGRGLTVVGDDAQSIYSFRAATVRNILDFPNKFQPGAKIIPLEQNYRSTQPILAASNAVISLAAERYTKNFWTLRASGGRPQLVSLADENEQARFVALRVLENREGGQSLKSQAVLFRASHHSAALELELTRLNIPFVKYRRPQISRRGAYQGRAGAAALRREPARPHRRFSRRAIAAGDWPGERGKNRRRGGKRECVRGAQRLSAAVASERGVRRIRRRF